MKTKAELKVEVDAKVAEITSALGQFNGSMVFYRCGVVPQMMFSEGAHFVAESCGAYWLIDGIAILQLTPKVRAEEFQIWKLAVTGHKAVLTLDDGNGNIIVRKSVSFTDFPLPEVTLWVENNTIYLPRER